MLSKLTRPELSQALFTTALFRAAVGLEIARLFASSPDPTPAPLIFLFNGAEETFSMGAHGFLSGHKWSDSIGAVINIESTGPGGPDIMFQAAGKELWPVRVYSEVVPYPRASVIAQVTHILKVGVVF